MAAAAGAPVKCARCGATGTGKFCANCGMALGESTCASCRSVLPAGARFCQQCGTPAGAAMTTAPAPVFGRVPAGPSRVPWIVTGAVTIIAIAAVVNAVARSGPSGPPAEATTATVAAPDISTMTPREQFDRLIDRVTVAAENGDTATVARFWPMASGAYQNLPPGDRNDDARFHMGWLHLFAAQYPEAKALADSITKSSPNHLFGDFLRASVARAQGDSAAARKASKAFVDHYDAEMAKGATDRPEYVQHKAMLEKFKLSGRTN